jgi:hypothetical protein
MINSVFFIVKVVKLDTEEDSVIYKCCKLKWNGYVKFEVITAVNLLLFDSVRLDTGNKVSIALGSFSFGKEELWQRGGGIECWTVFCSEGRSTRYLPKETVSNPRRPSFTPFYLSRIMTLHYFPLLATLCKCMLGSLFMATVPAAHIRYYCLCTFPHGTIKEPLNGIPRLVIT